MTRLEQKMEELAKEFKTITPAVVEECGKTLNEQPHVLMPAVMGEIDGLRKAHEALER